MSRTTFNVFEEGRRLAVFDVDQQSVGVDVGTQFEDWGALRVGLFRSRIEAGPNAGEIDLPEGRSISGESELPLIVRATVDDSSRGWFPRVQYLYSRSSFGGSMITRRSLPEAILYSVAGDRLPDRRRRRNDSAPGYRATTSSSSAVCSMGGSRQVNFTPALRVRAGRTYTCFECFPASGRRCVRGDLR